jgi:SH3 domain-containing YSC84-like protein 1
MRSIAFLPTVGAFFFSLFLTTPVSAQIKEGSTVDESTAVLTEIMGAPEKGIPVSLLSDAQGLAIVPNVVKGGFGIGVRFGRGVLLVRNEAGAWCPPSFISLTGGSFGWQLGIQSTDVVLVFRTRKSVQTLLSGKLTLGADAAVAAGPVGRQATAGADVTLRSAVYSYSRSRGLFLGLALDGTAILIDDKANVAFYGNNGQVPTSVNPQQPGAVPASAVRLLDYVTKYTTATVPPPSVPSTTVSPAPVPPPPSPPSQ